MKIKDLSKELNLPIRKLQESYSVSRGNVLCWSLKELLLAEYYRLQHNHLDTLNELFTQLVMDKPSITNGKSDAFEKHQFVLEDAYLQRLLVGYSKGNPFGVKL